MKRLRKLLLACAIVPLSQIAMQAAARAEEGGFVVAQADPPACQPGDPNCVPPEKVAPPQEKKPEVQPEPPAPKQEAEPPRPAPQPEVLPEAPAPRPEEQPQPSAPKPEVKPESAAPQPEVLPEAPAPRPEAQPQPSAPKSEAKPESAAPQPEVLPEAPAPRPEAQPEPTAPEQQTKPEQPRVEPQVAPEPAAPKLDSQPKAAPSEPKLRPERPAPKPDARPETPAAPAESAAPQPESKPGTATPEPTTQPKPIVPAPMGTPDKSAPQPPAPGAAAAPGTLPPPPAQPGSQPPPPPAVVEQQTPPPALIEKLGNSGAATAAAVDQSVDQKASNIRDVQRERRVISDENGVRVTVEPGGRVIVQSGEDAVIRHDDRDRFDRGGRDYRERQMRDGGREVVVTTRDGGEVRTIYDENGTMIRRERQDRDGGVYVLFDNRSFGPGPIDEPAWQPIVRLPPPPIYDMPREQYRVEMRSAPPRYVEEALMAPPLVEVQPQYTLNQVIYSPDLRDRVRSVDLDNITFPSGAWTVEASQVPGIEAVARGIEAALRRNPNEVFLVEGYTDAVGSVVDNLSLSDRRAEAVANILTDHYGIPPENLVTQGYGESYLKVQTEGPERANRRVMVRRITPLLTTKNQQQQ